MSKVTAAPRAVLEQTSNGTAAVTERVAAVVANPAAPLDPRARGSLCQLLGLIETVAGFLLVLTGGFATVDAADQSSVQHLLSRVAEGSATALVSTFTGVVASMLISLAAHLLAPAAE